MYAMGGGGIDINFAGSGIPERDPETGLYAEESDTISTYNAVAGGKTESTSAAVINLQGANMYGTNTPSKALPIDITDDFINQETGEPENQAGVYSILPTKIVWLNVLEDEVKATADKPWMNMFRTSTYRKGGILDDDQVMEINSLNEKNLGSGVRYRYKKVPFVIGNMKYGQVETGEKIESFNRSFRVPLEVVEKDMRAHKGKAWNQYIDAATAITRQLNPIWGAKEETKSSYDY